uniref:Uncharacterized protein n=1 Tax=Arundo donax TaxID=35708 RepID=A0A0A9EPB9_ARUDO
MRARVLIIQLRECRYISINLSS